MALATLTARVDEKDKISFDPKAASLLTRTLGGLLG